MLEEEEDNCIKNGIEGRKIAVLGVINFNNIPSLRYIFGHRGNKMKKVGTGIGMGGGGWGKWSKYTIYTPAPLRRKVDTPASG